MLIDSHENISGKYLNLLLNHSALKHTKYLGVYFDQHLTWTVMLIMYFKELEENFI